MRTLLLLPLIYLLCATWPEPARAELDPTRQLRRRNYKKVKKRKKKTRSERLFDKWLGFNADQETVFSDRERRMIDKKRPSLLSMSEKERKKIIDDGAYNFTDENAFIDVEDAVYSQQFVHRHLLSKTIHDTKPLRADEYYFNLMMNTSYVHQGGRTAAVNWAEFVTGGVGIAMGYTTAGGSSFEVGANLSSISTVYGGYRYIFGMSEWDVWPYAGAGVGLGMPFLNIARGQDEAFFYNGSTTVLSAVGGMLLPMPDVGIKIEVKLDMWGSDRLVFIPSLGLNLYL